MVGGGKQGVDTGLFVQRSTIICVDQRVTIGVDECIGVNKLIK